MNSKSFRCRGIIHRGVRFMQSAQRASDKNCVKNLCDYLSISESKAQYMCMKNPVITKLDDEKFKSLLDVIKEIGFTNDVLLEEPTLFGILPVTLKLRYKVLYECGIKNISPGILSSYLTILRQKTIGELKNIGEIPAHINVENRLASYMTQWPTSLTTAIYEDVLDTTLYKLRLKILQRYLELVLDLTNDEFLRGIETYPTIKHRPLEFINDTLKILLSQIMIPSHKIKTNLYLIHVDPDNLKNLIYKYRSIGGIDIKEVFRMHPKIATRNYATMMETRKVLTEFGISNEAQMRCFEIYTLSPETVRERLENAKTIPEFSAFFNHPRFLKMIYYNKTATKRLDQLYRNNKKCISLNVLSGSTVHYEVFEKAPGDRLGKGRDLLFCISQSLGNKYKKNHIHHAIRKHPFWINIPVVQVKYVYERLSLQFTDEDIYRNCCILLYPWNKVREAIKLIDKKQIKSILPFIHDCFNYDKISKSQKLSLVLYLIEKNHYFSGNGVWSDDKNRNVDKPQDRELLKLSSV